MHLFTNQAAKSPEADACKKKSSFRCTLKISAIFRCWGREQWFSMDNMTGMSEWTNADRLIASTTSWRINRKKEGKILQTSTPSQICDSKNHLELQLLIKSELCPKTRLHIINNIIGSWMATSWWPQLISHVLREFRFMPGLFNQNTSHSSKIVFADMLSRK